MCGQREIRATDAHAGQKIQGIGAGLTAGNVNLKFVDKVFKVSNDQAFAMAHRLAREEGLLMGISAGTVGHTAVQVARRPKNEGKLIVVVLPDTG
jgi:cysteine synthase A